jgi:hypothetical protein
MQQSSGVRAPRHGQPPSMAAMFTLGRKSPTALRSMYSGIHLCSASSISVALLIAFCSGFDQAVWISTPGTLIFSQVVPQWRGISIMLVGSPRMQ